jgi:hypothetical protein
MGDTELPLELETKTALPSGVTAMYSGPAGPTGIGDPATLVAVSTGVTELSLKLLT